MNKILKYILFIWLAAVICFAIIIPNKGSIIQARKFSNMFFDSTIAQNRILKSIPVYYENEKLQAVSDSNDVLLFNYKLDTTVYPITLLDTGSINYNMNKTQLVVSFDSLSNKYYGIKLNSISEIKKETNNSFEISSGAFKVTSSLNFKLDSLSITIVKDSLDYMYCIYKDEVNEYEFLLKKNVLRELKSSNSLISRVSYNSEKDNFIVDSLICVLEKQIEMADGFKNVKDETEYSVMKTNNIPIFRKYVNVSIYNFRLLSSANLDNIKTIYFEPGNNYIFLSMSNYEEIKMKKNFIAATAFESQTGTFQVASIIRSEPMFTFDYIPALGERSKILFFHVPTAWVSTIAFLMALIYGALYIKKRELIYDYRASSSAALGLLFAILATVTGAIWAKFNWGAFWNWDPRQISIFVLLLIYGAYFALRSAIESNETRAKLSSVYSILAGITVPFFIFVLPRIVESLHPDPIVNAEGKIHMNSYMLITFLSSLAGFTALYAWMLNLRIRIAKLNLREK